MSAALARLKALQAENPAKAPTVATDKTDISPFVAFVGGVGRHVWPDLGLFIPARTPAKNTGGRL